ncbi:hypothetical protein G807_04849 [Escherichia coli HVH 149 (4-4451880)]|nr:hypothetical protein G807_04849 [Escherichia coli HVH 149 (4-4451880)]
MDDEYSPLLTVGKMEQLVYLFSTASWTDFPCVYLAFFRSSARYVSCTGDHAAMGRNYRGSFFSTFASGGNRSTLMNPLMIFIKIIKLR